MTQRKPHSNMSLVTVQAEVKTKTPMERKRRKSERPEIYSTFGFWNEYSLNVFFFPLKPISKRFFPLYE